MQERNTTVIQLKYGITKTVPSGIFYV